MAASLNKVLLIGNLTRDPEVRYVPSGTAIANFTLAINRSYANQAGEKKEDVSFIRIVVWGKRGEVCGQYLTKGSPVFVEGYLRTRSWQTQDGQTRNAVEVVAGNVQFLRGASKGQGGQPQDTNIPSEEMGSIDLDIPRDMPGQGMSGGLDKEEDIPF